MSKKFKVLLLFAIATIFLISVAVIIYPLASNLQAEKQKDAIVLRYQKAISSDEMADKALSAARMYNATLSNGQTFSTEYEQLLDPNRTGMMGIVTIPAIGVELPIYHGNQSLELGAVHLQGTSLPVGGKGTHCVISAHSGMSTQKMFTDLNQLVIGDVFCLTVYGKQISYEVDQILTVLPEETGPLQIEKGADYCTLLTCTPYGINTHRLLVRGSRVEILEKEIADIEIQQKPSTWTQEYLKGILYGIGFVVLATATIGAFLFIQKRRKNKCAKKH